MNDRDILHNSRQWPVDHMTAAVLLAGHPLLAEQVLQPLGHGDFCIAFTMSDHVLRIARHEAAAAALRREACVLEAVADRLPLSVPRPVHHSTTPYPPYSIHKLIEGLPLTPEHWRTLPSDAREQAARDIAHFLKTLHGIPTEHILCDLPVYGQDYITALLEKARAVLYPLLTTEVQQHLEESIARHTGSQRPSLLHCDIAPDHVLYNSEKSCITGIIDFGDIAIGEPARDFIYLFEDYGSDILAAILEHYTDTNSQALLYSIQAWYLVETIAWILTIAEQPCRSQTVDEGLRELHHVLSIIEHRST